MNFEEISAEVILEVDPLAIMLGFSGFTNQEVIKVREDGFDQIEDIGIDVLEEQDIKDLYDSLGILPTAVEKQNFGIARTKRHIEMMNWIQYHERLSLEVAVSVGTTQKDMRDMWTRALESDNVRKFEVKKSKATQVGAYPGELKSDKGFYNWDFTFDNYLSSIPGQNEVPLSYVNRVYT